MSRIIGNTVGTPFCVDTIIEAAKTELIGTADDESTANTINGAKTYTQEIFSEHSSNADNKYVAKTELSLPDYVMAESESVIDRVIAAQGNRTFTFAAITDMHYGNASYTDGVEHACKALKYIDERIKLDAVAVLGDYTDGYPATGYDNAIGDFRSINAVLDALRFAPNIRIQGNHDYYADNAPIIHRYIQAYSEDVVWGSKIGGYFYKDIDTFKIRIICVNTTETGNANIACSLEQYNWFIESLDMTSKEDASEWSILILSHHPLDWYVSDSVYRFGNILWAYTNGTSWSGGDVSCDFTDKNSATVIANIHGHIHNLLTDGIYRNVGNTAAGNAGVYRMSTPEACINRANQYSGIWQEGTSYPKTTGTADETSFVVYCVDLDSHTINAICYGAGYDRTIDYTTGIQQITYSVTNNLTNVTNDNGASVIDAGSSYTATLTPDGDSITSVVVTMSGADVTSSVYADGVISISAVTGNIVITAVGAEPVVYTNMIPLSVDSDGALYNGGQGWKADTRLNSGGTEAAYTGVEVIGFIPVSLGDVIYFDNIKYRANGDGTYNGQEYLAFYDSSKTKLASGIISYVAAYFNSVDADEVVSRRDTTDNNFNLKVLSTTELINWDDATNNKWSGASDMAYFRISAEEITDDSIITINEPIE